MDKTYPEGVASDKENFGGPVRGNIEFLPSVWDSGFSRRTNAAFTQ